MRTSTLPAGRIQVQKALPLAALAALAILALLAAGADALAPTGPGTVHAGEVWVMAWGIRSCEHHVHAPGSPAFVPTHPQLWIYEGNTSTFEGTADQVLVLSYTMHDATYVENGRWSATGNMQASCEGLEGPDGLLALVNGIGYAQGE